ncbi:MAG: D-alanine--D-alanine ligase [Parcubacteria group bacterium]
MRKIRIAVLMGGPSSEHDVSIASGKMVCDNLDKERYEVIPVHISRDGEWSVSFEELIDRADIAFIALHGEYGEDGTVQQFLESIGLPYTGSSAKASALGMNKLASAKLFTAHDLNVPAWKEITRYDDWAHFGSPFDYPVVVKPADRGSSIGTSIARNEFYMREALCKVFEVSRTAMVQKYISGREVTCGVLEDEHGNIPLPPTEVFPVKAELFDYEAKYVKGASKEITPAPITKRETEEVQETALAVHRIIDASGYSRTDMIIGNNGQIYVLEINTLPGLDPATLLPQEANYMGLSNSALLDKIIAAAIRRYGR